MGKSERIFNKFLRAYAAEAGAGAAGSADAYRSRFAGAADRIASFFVATNAPADDLGRRVGAYRLLRRLGAGGQGRVYLAHDERLQRRAAVKIANPGGFGPEERARFRREAEVAGRLAHPGLVTIYDASFDGDTPYIAMRLVEGPTLAKRIAEDRDAEPRTRVAAAVRTVEEIARALHVAHEAGIVHRDVKPSNVVLEGGDRPVVVDFGLAAGGENAATLTSEMFELGTVGYLAPERLTTPSRALDRRVDVYALGVVLYEWLAGRRPFEAPSPYAVLRLAEAGPPPTPAPERGVPPDLSVVVATALAADPTERYATCLDLAEDLARVRRDEPIRARPPSTTRKLRHWYRRRRAFAHAAVVAAACLFAAFCFRADALDAEAERAGLRRDNELDRVMEKSDAVARGAANPRSAGADERAVLRALLADCAELSAAFPHIAALHERLEESALENQRLGVVDVALNRRLNRAFACRSFVESFAQGTAAQSPRVALMDRLRYLTEVEDASVDRYADRWKAVAVGPAPRIPPTPGWFPLRPDATGRFAFLDLWTTENPFGPPPDVGPDAGPDVGVVYMPLPTAEGLARTSLLARDCLDERVRWRIVQRGYGGNPSPDSIPTVATFTATNSAQLALSAVEGLSASMPSEAERSSVAPRPDDQWGWRIAADAGEWVVEPGPRYVVRRNAATATAPSGDGRIRPVRRL